MNQLFGWVKGEERVAASGRSKVGYRTLDFILTASLMWMGWNAHEWPT